MKAEQRKLIEEWRARAIDWRDDGRGDLAEAYEERANELESILAREDEPERAARDRLVKSDDDTPYLDAPVTAMVRMPDGRHFRCTDCGANCFTRRGERFHCNGCDAVYVGEPTDAAERSRT